MHIFYQPYPYEFQWTKDHPLEEVIGEPSRPVLIRNQLRSDGDMCMYALTVSTMEPKNVKEAMTDPAWIDSMQEEPFQFKRLDNHFFKGTIDPTLFIRRFHDDILVSKYVLEILRKYGMESCDPVGTPMEIKDKLDLDHNGLWYSKDSGFKPTGFSDDDYVGCKDTFKSTFGGAQFLGEKLVSWSSKNQECTALSTAEAEYVSLSACCAQVLWMQTQLTDYGFHFNKIPIYCDSKSAIAISCNPVQHSRTKHIDVRYHFIKEHVEKGTIELYVKTDYQLVDLFTKALPADRFNYLVRCLGMCSLSP
nr:retrovirus-related Pol polyprotein from transposon TNT 1-94 [Tanacetum cinerariifolium]